MASMPKIMIRTMRKTMLKMMWPRRRSGTAVTNTSLGMFSPPLAGNTVKPATEDKLSLLADESGKLPSRPKLRGQLLVLILSQGIKHKPSGANCKPCGGVSTVRHGLAEISKEKNRNKKWYSEAAIDFEALSENEKMVRYKRKGSHPCRCEEQEKKLDAATTTTPKYTHAEKIIAANIRKRKKTRRIRRGSNQDSEEDKGKEGDDPTKEESNNEEESAERDENDKGNGKG